MVDQIGSVGHSSLTPAINEHTIFVFLTMDFIYNHSFFPFCFEFKIREKGQRNKIKQKKQTGKKTLANEKKVIPTVLPQIKQLYLYHSWKYQPFTENHWPERLKAQTDVSIKSSR